MREVDGMPEAGENGRADGGSDGDGCFAVSERAIDRFLDAADLQRQLLIQLIPSFISAAVFLTIGYMISPILSLVLIGALAAMVYVRLARQR